MKKFLPLFLLIGGGIAVLLFWKELMLLGLIAIAVTVVGSWLLMRSRRAPGTITGEAALEVRASLREAGQAFAGRNKLGKAGVLLDDLKEARDAHRKDLATKKGKVRTKEREIGELEGEAATLRAKIKFALDQGDQDNAKQRGELLLDLNKRIEAKKAALQGLKTSVSEADEAVRKCTNLIKKAEQRAETLEVRKETAELKNEMTASSEALANNSGSLMSRVEELLDGTEEDIDVLEATVNDNPDQDDDDEQFEKDFAASQTSGDLSALLAEIGGEAEAKDSAPPTSSTSETKTS